MRVPCFAICLFVLSGGAAAAQDSCQTLVTNAEMIQCAYDTLDLEDAKLNQAYQDTLALMKQLDIALPAAERGGAQALQEGQRAWITFRDKACEAEGFSMRGGSAEPLMVAGCKTQLTIDRTNNLRSFVDTFGKD